VIGPGFCKTLSAYDGNGPPQSAREPARFRFRSPGAIVNRYPPLPLLPAVSFAPPSRPPLSNFSGRQPTISAKQRRGCSRFEKFPWWPRRRAGAFPRWHCSPPPPPPLLFSPGLRKLVETSDRRPGACASTPLFFMPLLLGLISVNAMAATWFVTLPYPTYRFLLPPSRRDPVARPLPQQWQAAEPSGCGLNGPRPGACLFAPFRAGPGFGACPPVAAGGDRREAPPAVRAWLAVCARPPGPGVPPPGAHRGDVPSFPACLCMLAPAVHNLPPSGTRLRCFHIND